MGGCLFIDEAYSLAEGDGPIGSGGDSFAKEAVRTMLTEFENNRTDLMVVMAGCASHAYAGNVIPSWSASLMVYGARYLAEKLTHESTLLQTRVRWTR
jgi:hypothetical protein